MAGDGANKTGLTGALSNHRAGEVASGDVGAGQVSVKSTTTRVAESAGGGRINRGSKRTILGADTVDAGAVSVAGGGFLETIVQSLLGSADDW